MGRFYIRVYENDKRVRTLGCGSRGENRQNLVKCIDKLDKDTRRYLGLTDHKDLKLCISRLSPNVENPFKIYKFELVRNRHGEKKVYYSTTITMSQLAANIPICQTSTYGVLY